MRKGAILLLIVLLSLAPGTMSQAASGGNEKQVIEVSGAASMFGRIHTLSKQFASSGEGFVSRLTDDRSMDNCLIEGKKFNRQKLMIQKPYRHQVMSTQQP